MPGITLTIGRQPKEKKPELIRELTAAASRVTGIPAGSFTVYITEFEDDCIGVGGETLAEVKAKRAQADRGR